MDENKKSDNFSKLKLLFKNRKFKCGTTATVFTVLFIAVVIGLNMVTGALNDKFQLSFDLTSNKAFTLTEQTKEFISDLDKDVEIILLNNENEFSSANEYFSQANTVLKQYAKYSNKIKLTYLDLAKNPTFLQNNYPNENLTTNSIIVRSDKKHKIITINDIFDISYGYYGAQGIKASKAEQELTSALLYVTSESQTKVAFIKGYDEQDFSAFSEILKKNNYDVNEVSILTEDIPEDVKAVIVFGPSRDYDSKGIAKLEQLLKNSGKNIFYAPNPNKSEKPLLDAFLSEWGIKVGKGIVYETDSHRMTSNMNIFESISDYVDSEYTKELTTTDIPVLIPASRPIEVLDKDNVKVLLQYPQTAGIMPVDAKKDFDFKKNVSGPICSAVVASKTLENENVSNNVAVIGSYVALSDDYLAATSINNSAYFTNMLNMMVNREDSGILIESKSIENEELGINAASANAIGIMFSIILPLIVITIGVLVFIKRKNK